jgi:uncharacterized OB-fold protein
MHEQTSILPITDRRSEEWFAAAAEGRLLVQRCTACGRHQFYPRRHCAACGVLDVEWTEATGTGRLHTFTVVHRTPNAEFGARTPYVFAIVELDEGPRMTTSIVGVPFDRLRCDMPVHVVFPEAAEGAPVLPVFTPIEDV